MALAAKALYAQRVEHTNFNSLFDSDQNLLNVGMLNNSLMETAEIEKV